MQSLLKLKIRNAELENLSNYLQENGIPRSKPKVSPLNVLRLQLDLGEVKYINSKYSLLFVFKNTV